MIGVIHSIDNPILTILIQECCRVRMERCWLNVTKTPPVGSKVCYETETHDYRLIPRITRIEEYDFDNCSTCGKAYEQTDAQFVSFVDFNC